MSGWTDFPLSPLGRRQAEALARRLANEPPVSALYTSPLERARDTARALTVAGLPAPKPLDDLREQGCGEVDGWPVSEVRKHFPGSWEANFRQDDPDFRWPGGESHRELRERCLGAIRRIAASHLGERIAIVTHAGVICTVVGWLHGTGPAEWEKFRPGNCSLTEIDWTGDHGTVLCFDDRAHLVGVEVEDDGVVIALDAS